MDPLKRKRQSEELAVWNERLLAWEAHKKSGAPPRRLLEWCMDNGAPYSGMQNGTVHVHVQELLSYSIVCNRAMLRLWEHWYLHHLGE